MRKKNTNQLCKTPVASLASVTSSTSPWQAESICRAATTSQVEGTGSVGMDRPRTIHPDREKLTIRHTNPFLPSDYSTQTFFFLSSEEAQARNIVGKSRLVLSMHFVLQQFMRQSAVTMRHTYTYGVVMNSPSFCSLGCLFQSHTLPSLSASYLYHCFMLRGCM